MLLISLGGLFEFYDMFFTAYVAPGMVASGLFKRASLEPMGFLFDVFGGGPATFVFSTFAGLFFGTILFGQLSDRFGRRKVFIGALLWYSLTTFGMAFQTTGFSLNAWRFVSGLGIGVQLVTIASYLSELVPRQFRGRVFAVNQVVQFCAVPIVAFLAWTLAPHRPLGLGVTVTTSLLYSFIIAIANPVGPLLGYFVADRIERKWQIVLAALGVAVFGLIFAGQRQAAPLIVFGVLITLFSNWMSFSFHNYQSEIFPTRIRARAVGFVYSWSRLSSAFTGLIIGILLKSTGTMAVFALIAFAMGMVMLSIGGFGPRTRGRSLEEICPETGTPAAPLIPAAVAGA